jgi:hypothetical protein
LGVSNDCLSVLAQNETILDTWVMMDYGNKDSWTKLFTVPFVKFLGYIDLRCDTLYINEENDQVVLHNQMKVYAYNYKNGTVKIHNIQELPSTPFPFNVLTSNVYVESLVSP